MKTKTTITAPTNIDSNDVSVRTKVLSRKWKGLDA